MLTACLSARGQYQLENSGFEQWDGDNTSEPAHWNTFGSSDGSYSGLASSNHHYRRAGGRPGSGGSYYLTIYTRSMMGVKANGNMTTGRIHVGALSATSADNYNYTQRSNDAFSQAFTATPDSLRVWVSYYAADAASEASVEAFIHGDCDFRTPNDAGDKSLYWGHARVAVTRTTSSATSPVWQQVTVPFVYDGNATPAYVIANLTSNTEPGAGSAGDSLMVDDLEFVYSNWLSSIWINGHKLHQFEKDRTSYYYHVDDASLLTPGVLFAKAEVGDATVTYSYDTPNDTTLQGMITVRAEDGSERTYEVTLTTGPADETLAVTVPDEGPAMALPNPVGEWLLLRGNGRAVLTDLSGREVMSGMVAGSATWKVGNLRSGIYLLDFNQRRMTIIKK